MEQRVTLTDPRKLDYFYEEAIKTLRTNIQFSGRDIKTIMFTCGMYDGSGTSAVYVGLPAKSGVGGGILSLADKKMGIGIYGPSLDQKGNSIAGQEMLRLLSKELKLHLFA